VTRACRYTTFDSWHLVGSLCVGQHGADRATSEACTAVTPRKLTLRLGGFLGQDVALERLRPRLMLPLALTLKRLAAPFLVFILGMKNSILSWLPGGRPFGHFHDP
jgi:hypothetical protein